MASAAVTPRVRAMLACQGIRSVGDAVYDLKGVHYGQTIAEFPFAPRRLSLFLVLASPRAGRFPAMIRIIHDRTDHTAFMTHIDPVFDQDEELKFFRIRLRCRFRVPGRYTIQVTFLRTTSSDVVKGEIPFDVVIEEGA